MLMYCVLLLLLLLLFAGAANAGIPLSIIVKEYGWAAYFNTLIGACALALLLLSPMMNLKSFVQRREIYLQRKLKGQ
jgi:sugar phosphate permease